MSLNPLSLEWKWLHRTRESVYAPEIDAFEALIESCWDKLWRYAYRLAGDPHEAEDLLSETLLEAYKDFEGFRGQSSFERWMFRIMTTTRIDMARRAKRRAAESLDAIEGAGESDARLIDLSQNPETRLIDTLMDQEIQQALDSLSEEFRAAILLAEVEGLDYAEIAEILQVPIGTVRSRIHRARAQLKKQLTSYAKEKGYPL